MPGMQQVEASIGESDPSTTYPLTIDSIDQFGDRQNLSLKFVVFASERPLESCTGDYFCTLQRYLDARRGIGEEGRRKQRLARRGDETEDREHHITRSSDVIHVARTGRNMMSLTIAFQQVHTVAI